MKLLACLLALFWGVLWALFLQFAPLGRWLVIRRTWITVIIGVGVDLLILLAVVPFDAWLWVVLIITLSSIPIIIRSLANERDGDEELIDVLGDHDQPD